MSRLPRGFPAGMGGYAADAQSYAQQTDGSGMLPGVDMAYAMSSGGGGLHSITTHPTLAGGAYNAQAMAGVGQTMYAGAPGGVDGIGGMAGLGGVAGLGGPDVWKPVATLRRPVAAVGAELQPL